VILDAASLDPYIFGGLIGAAVVLISYFVLRMVKRHAGPQVGDVVLLGLETTGVTAGVRLPIVAISADNLGPFQSEDRIFISLAGLALILVASHEIFRVFRENAWGLTAGVQATAGAAQAAQEPRNRA
jgi:hypothetical protein